MGWKPFRGTFIASALAIAGLGLVGPAGASAATTLGQTFPPTGDLSCGATYEVVQVHRGDGTPYAAPSPGVLTSWSFEASTIDSTTLTLRVFRPTTPQHFTVIAEGGPQRSITQSSGLHTFTTQISVEAGDLIGIHSTAGPCGSMTLDSGDVYDSHFGTVTPVGMTGLYSEGSQQIFDIAASLEPDCDKDGLGDESQDPNVTAACPTPAGPGSGSTGQTGQPATKKKCKKHKKKHKRSAESAKKKHKKCKKKKKKHG